MPNIVQWAAVRSRSRNLNIRRLSLPRLRGNARFVMSQRRIAEFEKNSVAINIASKPAAIPKPKMPLSAMTAPVAPQHHAPANAAPAPDIGGAAGRRFQHAQTDRALRHSWATRARVEYSRGESRSPHLDFAWDGRETGEGGTSANGAAGMPAAKTRMAASCLGNPRLPEAREQALRPQRSASAAAARLIREMEEQTEESHQRETALENLISPPETPYEPSAAPRNGPANVAALDPSLPPEKILGSEVYTLHVNLPNLTSASGSWILNFAELDEGELYSVRKKDPLAAPVPLETVDPKYPPELIKGHVHGEVVLYAIIRKDGSIDSIQVVRTLEPQLDRNAIDALGKWKFRPAARSGSPVDIEVVVHIPFTYVDPRY